jgi:hypothetical protein
MISMPTLTECLAAELTPRLEALWESSSEFRGLAEGFKRLFQQIVLVIRFIAESPPSLGYEPFLIEHLRNRFVARALAMVAVRSGRRRAAESKRRGPVFRAIRFLAQPDRRKDASLRRASLLLAAWEETSIIAEIFDEVGASQPSFKKAHPNAFEFVSLLESAIERREITGQLREIAAALAPHLSISRGPKISAASASHEFLVEAVFRDKPPTFTWNAFKRDFTDSFTRATRREFNNPNFSPQAAYRRVKRRRVTKLD